MNTNKETAKAFDSLGNELKKGDGIIIHGQQTYFGIVTGFIKDNDIKCIYVHSLELRLLQIHDNGSQNSTHTRTTYINLNSLEYSKLKELFLEHITLKNKKDIENLANSSELLEIIR